MKKVRKKTGKIVTAYCLGEEQEAIRQLMEAGKIVKTASGRYEVFSQEAVHGKGEQAYEGDFIKLDEAGMPYPNDAQFFKKNHRHLEGNQYEQIPVARDAWTAEDEMCEEVQYLIQHKGLMLDKDNEKNYFTASLWGTVLSAPKDAILLFYRIDRNELGTITDIDFNFIQKEEFDKTYDVI